jgi:hypothetical protein
VTTPPSGLDRLDVLIDATATALDALLDRASIRHDDINARGGDVFVVGWNKWQWAPLPADAQPSVGAARQAYERLNEFSACAVRTGAGERARELVGPGDALVRIIEQSNGSLPRGAPARDVDGVRAVVRRHLDSIAAVVRGLPTAHGDGEQLLVADTSALLDRPDLQAWNLDGTPWVLVLLPQVLSELDERKRDDRTREAAQKVIRQVEEFDRRGDTLVGVPLAGNLSFREVAVTADMTQTLGWLRADVPDDAIVAGALELGWRDLTARVAVVASDRGARNKARLAGLHVVRTSEL